MLPSFEITPEEVHLWTARGEGFAEQIPALTEVLAAHERERAGRYVAAADRSRFIIGRALLRLILSRYLAADPAQIQFTENEYGRPGLLAEQNPGDLRFNLSHSGEALVYAIARARAVGVDVERIRPVENQDLIARRYFAPHESGALASLAREQQPRMFFTHWTRREALAKALGRGLALPARELQALASGAGSALSVVSDYDSELKQDWELREVELWPEYAAALAVEGHGWELVAREWRGD